MKKDNRLSRLWDSWVRLVWPGKRHCGITYKTLIRQHEAQAMAAKEQIAASTQAVLEAVKEGIRNVRDDIKENGD